MAEVATREEPTLKRVMGPGLLLLFVVGDILGTGVYALTGRVANEVGGAVWLPFLCSFVVACSGLTSASSASKAFAENFGQAFDVSLGEGLGLTAVALGF